MLIVALCVAYAMGCFSPGWFLVRRATGEDLREKGSGGTGATNAARVLGRWGFAIVLLLDAGKAAAAVLFARWLTGHAAWSALACPAAVAAAGAALGALVSRRSFVITTSAALAGVAAAAWLLSSSEDRVAFGIAVGLVILAHRSHFVRVLPRPRSHTHPSSAWKP